MDGWRGAVGDLEAPRGQEGFVEIAEDVYLSRLPASLKGGEIRTCVIGFYRVSHNGFSNVAFSVIER